MLQTLTSTKHLKTNFIFRSLLENEREQAVQFIEQDEIKCAALMEKLLQGAEDVFVLENVQTKMFCALFYLRNSSTLFHYIPFLEKNSGTENSTEIKEIKNLIGDFLSQQKIFCLYGENYGSEFIKSILLENKKELIVTNDYILMENDFSDDLYRDEIMVQDQWKDLTVRKCSLDDCDGLIQLERGYRIEEVAITEREETDRVIQFVLTKSLSTQTIFSAYRIEKGKYKAVAKAATNACGKKYCQIGGVYCDREFRNKGIMFYVMQHLMRFIQSQNKNACLFVKVKNEPAKKLYAKLGFIPVGKYQISYFQK